MSKNLTPAQKAAATRAANAQAAKQEQLKAARKEARELKKQREAAEAKAAEHVKRVQQEAEHVNIEDLFEESGMWLPSWKRVMVGLVLGVLAAGAVGYGIGTLMAYALAGIMVLTASVAMQFVLSVLVWVIGIYSSWKIGGWVGSKVFASVVLPEGLASKSYDSVANAAGSAKAKIGGWFSDSKAAQSAKSFSGAFVKPSAA